MNTQKNTSFVYKNHEEKLLRENIVSSGIITQEQLQDIKSAYHENVPYHNFLHALMVAKAILLLPKEEYDIIEIRSLFIAALFHDAGHTWVAGLLDEFRSLDIAFQGIIDFEKKYDYAGIDYGIVRKAIIWTVFKNRAKNTDPYAILLADLDVSTIGMIFPAFLYYCDFPICLEFGKNIEEWLDDINYFKFLLSVDKHVFRTECVKSMFPDALKNMKLYTSLPKSILIKAFHFWKSDITYAEFESNFQKIQKN